MFQQLANDSFQKQCMGLARIRSDRRSNDKTYGYLAIQFERLLPPFTGRIVLQVVLAPTFKVYS